jgi:hypothetical protein
MQLAYFLVALCPAPFVADLQAFAADPQAFAADPPPNTPRIHPDAHVARNVERAGHPKRKPFQFSSVVRSDHLRRPRSPSTPDMHPDAHVARNVERTGHPNANPFSSVQLLDPITRADPSPNTP